MTWKADDNSIRADSLDWTADGWTRGAGGWAAAFRLEQDSMRRAYRLRVQREKDEVAEARKERARRKAEQQAAEAARQAYIDALIQQHQRG